MSFALSAVQDETAPANAAWRPVQLAFNPATGSYELCTLDGVVVANDDQPPAEPPAAPSESVEEDFHYDMLGWVALGGPAWGNIFNGPNAPASFDARPAALEGVSGLCQASLIPAVRANCPTVQEGLALYA
jgi:hypothetical protein